MRVLIVKVSSLGDIIHTLPALTDAFRARRDLRFDWVVEEAFTEIPGWHPAVNRVIPVAIRRWRRELFKTWRSGEFAAFRQDIQQEYYDLVIDAQGLIKSGLISRLARGLTVGLSNRTIREPLATLFYNVSYNVPWQQHAVQRVRDLFARTFNYPLDNQSCDYGLDPSLFLPPGALPGQEKSLLFLHGTTWESKRWPTTYWQQLVKLAGEKGFRVKLPWGSQEELVRAKAIADGSDNVTILDPMSLTDIARELVLSQAVVAVDTGLAHLAAALNVPVVSLYGASNPKLTGTYGRRQLHLQSDYPCSPCFAKRCRYRDQPPSGQARSGLSPPCFSSHPPQQVWQSLEGLLQGGRGSLDDCFYTLP